MNHMTPSQLAKLFEKNEEDIINDCIRLGIPIVHGRIDKILYQQAESSSGKTS